MIEVLEQGQAWVHIGDDLQYSHTTVILRKGDNIFHARTKHRYSPSETINPDNLEMRPIPVPEIWPLFSNDLTRAPNPLPVDSYVKRPSLLYCCETDDFHISDLLLNEARICEILRKYPHPNIAQYLGCTVQGNRITGLSFVKYDITLADRLKDHDRPLNRDRCWKGIERGVQHLHSLGLIHNDLNPHNIMLNSDDTPVIIDFDSCRREGDKLLKAGTWGWADESSTLANTTNDYYGLKKIREAMGS